MKRSLGAGEWIRRGLGAAVLAGVAAIALGLDTGFLDAVSTASTDLARAEAARSGSALAANAQDQPSSVGGDERRPRA